MITKILPQYLEKKKCPFFNIILTQLYSAAGAYSWVIYPEVISTMLHCKITYGKLCGLWACTPEVTKEH